ncbi:hypothetical protein DTX80_07595 [Bacilli bacterium]|nr:hypothetical protein WH51_12255 [Bacilli bacterium VT-13-104]PZD85398.1 hypothetical protein DEJ64_09745 [Bacilli bacterium]PZD89122.1 hypothetical protein DEJ60_05260 [Bacilli bacterium]PZD91695.1 hypothetical protein DEJ66_05685 [Bacilli bacterium]RCO06144.1 hypothetical protein DTX80_07595 [Bacilli bacterium]
MNEMQGQVPLMSNRYMVVFVKWSPSFHKEMEYVLFGKESILCDHHRKKKVTAQPRPKVNG